MGTSNDGQGASGKSVLEVWLTFVAAFAWPLALLTVVLLYRSQLTELTGRVKTGEFAGAKFEFSEAAAGFIRDSVDDLAKEQNPNKRAELAQNIRSVADALSALHPISLALLITGAKNCHSWGGVPEDELAYFAKLEDLGLVHIARAKSSAGESISLRYTDKGKDLLLRIGMSPEDLESAERCR